MELVVWLRLGRVRVRFRVDSIQKNRTNNHVQRYHSDGTEAQYRIYKVVGGT